MACLDLSVQKLDAELIEQADLVAVYLPMHTATRLATKVLNRVRELNSKAHVCCYGLYAPLNATHLQQLGAQTILGGEFEEGLVQLVKRLTTPHPTRKSPEPHNVHLLRQTTVFDSTFQPAGFGSIRSSRIRKRRATDRWIHGSQQRM